jgi:GcrA cell cycle regulator
LCPIDVARRLGTTYRGNVPEDLGMGWTDERVELLKRLWLEGLSASQVAKQLGGVTRNAVIGKVHRLGLSGRATPSQPTRTTFKAPRPPRSLTAGHALTRRPSERRIPAPAAPRAAPYVELPGTATVLTLGAHMCKWPIGDPSTDDFSFCGRRASAEGPYCVEHARVAYQPPQAKRKASASELARSLRRYI